LNYIKQHWQGKLPLALSFWLNGAVIWLGIYVLSAWVKKSSPIEDPALAARAYVSLYYFVLLIILPWQVTGVWRASRRYTKTYASKAWGEVVRLVMALVLLRALGLVFVPSPVMQARLKTGFSKDQFAGYQISLTDSGKLLRVSGPLGFGVSKKVNRLLGKNPEVSGVILDSGGGWIYEGRQLATLILYRHLDTFVQNRCSSACVLAYAAGERRYLVQGARLGFHQYQVQNKQLNLYFDQRDTQKTDREFYLGRGIKPAFVDQIFKTGPNNIWHPDQNELLAAGVVHSIIYTADF
jgi:hypothetical protein